MQSRATPVWVILLCFAAPSAASAQADDDSASPCRASGTAMGRWCHPPAAGRNVVACVMEGVPSKVPTGGRTPAPGRRLPLWPGSARVGLVFDDSPLAGPVTPAGSIATCHSHADCLQGSLCAGNFCRLPEDVPQGGRFHWTSSDPTVLRVSNEEGRRGQLTGLRSGVSQLGVTFLGDDGPLACVAPEDPFAPASMRVSVIPRMLCDLIVTTRPWRPAANPGSVDTSEGNRAGRSLGIDDGQVDAYPQGLALRRAYFPHATSPPEWDHQSDTNSALGNDPRVLLPALAGLKQLFRAIGMFADAGDPANCTAPPSAGRLPMFAFDVSGEAAWGVTGASDPDSPDHTGPPLGVDAAVKVMRGAARTLDPIAGSRLQAVRATVNSGPRLCTGLGSPSLGVRDPRQACRHALVFEVCGAGVDTSPGSVALTPWAPPDPSHRSPFGFAKPNPPLEGTAPATLSTYYYLAVAGESTLRYYALQRVVARSCRLSPAAAYWIELGQDASWTSTNPAAATVEPTGRLRAAAGGTTTIMVTMPDSRLGSSMDFYVLSLAVP